MGARGEFRQVNDKGPWAPLVLDPSSLRKDRSRRLRLSVLNRGFTIYGFSPQLALVGDERRSTTQGYDYRHNRAAMLSFVQQF